MSVFSSLRETRQLGAPVVGLFRTALARDPDPAELERLALLVRDRTPLATIARQIAATAEFLGRYAGLSSAARAEIFLHNAFGPAQDGSAVALAPWMGADEELIALITEAALTKKAIPLLPGLAPGAAPDDDAAYRLWVAEYDQPVSLSEPEPGRQRVSLLMRAGDTEAEAVQRSVASLSRQTYQLWELCLAARTMSPWSQRAVEALAQDEPRVRLVADYSLEAAFEAATGAFVGVLAPGDRLAPDALARATKAFESPIGMVFTDEDVEDASGRHSARFKPGFSPDLLLEGDAVGGLAIVRRDVLQPSDLLEPITERALAVHAAHRLAPTLVRHLPFVGLHRATPPRPCHFDIVAGAPFAVPQPPPPVTVIVLTKDHADLLASCARGLLEQTDYPSLELLLVDNGTTDSAALSLLADLERREHVRVLRRPGPFNFAALNNEAARAVRGGVLLLLNNDVEVLGPEWLSEMVAQLARPGVGVVGARLLYPDRTIQHAGILLGPAGAATHVGRGAPETATGYFGQLAGVRDFSAVTGACLAIETATWERLGGMDERFAVTWNDVDLCLRVRQAGLRVVWTPRATLIHKESTTRGLEMNDPAKLARFRQEQALMLAEWPEAFERDPFLNANLLALDSGQLVLTRPRQLASRA